MINKIDDLRKKQQGYVAAMSAVTQTKPQKVKVFKTDGEKGGSVTVSYDPSDDTFTLSLDATSERRYAEYLKEIPMIDAKLIFAALSEFFKEEADAT
jgi:hypothetical protein